MKTHHISKIETERPVFETSKPDQMAEQSSQKTGITPDPADEEAQAHRFANVPDLCDVKSFLLQQAPDRGRRKEEEVVRDDLPPARPEQTKPRVVDIRGLDDQVATRPEDPPQFTQLGPRITKMLDDVVKHRDVELVAGKTGSGQPAITAVDPAGSRDRRRRPIRLDPGHPEVCRRHLQKLARRTANLEKLTSVDESQQICQPLPSHCHPPGSLRHLDRLVDQLELPGPDCQTIHRGDHPVIRLPSLPHSPGPGEAFPAPIERDED